MTAALEGGWVVSSTPQPYFTPRKDPVPIVQEAGWAPEQVCMGKNLAPLGFDPRTVQPIVSRYTDWATQPTVWEVPGSNIKLQTGCLDWCSTWSFPVPHLQINGVIKPKYAKKNLWQCHFVHHFSCFKFGLLQQEAGDWLPEQNFWLY
jgi:hypothetical protein